MKNIIPFFAMVLMICSCKKEHSTNPYSNWIINGRPFSSNNVNYWIGKNGFSFRSSEAENFFYFSNRSAGQAFCAFNIGQQLLPPYMETNDLTYRSVIFQVDSIQYTPMPNHLDTLDIAQVNGKLQYVLRPSWFVNRNNVFDSVLIEGTFNQP